MKRTIPTFLRPHVGTWTKAALGAILLCLTLIPVTMFAGAGTLLSTNSLGATFYGFSAPSEQYITKLQAISNGSYDDLYAYASDGSSGIILRLDRGVDDSIDLNHAATEVSGGRHFKKLYTWPDPSTGYMYFFAQDDSGNDAGCFLTRIRNTYTWTLTDFEAPGPKVITGFKAGTNRGKKTLSAESSVIPPHTRFSFIHMTDTHVYASNQRGSGDADGLIFHDAMQQISGMNPKPAFVAITGDLVDFGASGLSGDGLQNYAALTQHLTPYNDLFYTDATHTIPVYMIPGNHDPRGCRGCVYGSDYTNYWNEIGRHMPDSYRNGNDYAIAYGNTLLIFMDSGYDCGYDANHPDGSGLTQSQWDWLTGENGGAGVGLLSYTNKIIFMHHPLVDASGQKCDKSAFAPVNPDDATICHFREGNGGLIGDYGFLHYHPEIKVVFAGHEHQDVVVNVPGTSGTICVQTGAGYLGQYRKIDVSGSLVDVKAPETFNGIYCHLPPPAPTGVSASDDRSTDVQVAWDNVTDAWFYWVLRSAACGETDTIFGPLFANGFTDDTAVPGTTYQYAVVATGQYGDSPFGACDAGTRLGGQQGVFFDDFNDNDISDWMQNAWGWDADAIADSGRMRLRVYKCSSIEVLKSLGPVSGPLTFDFDWQTYADGWYEPVGWKVIVDGIEVSNKGIPIGPYGGYSGHETQSVNVNGNVQLMFWAYQSVEWCFMGDHGNTYLWIDNIKVAAGGH